MPMTIEGVSCLGAFGCGLAALRSAVLGEGKTDFFPQVDTARLTDYFPARSLRQMDRFSRMALLGARLVLEDAARNDAARNDTARHNPAPENGGGHDSAADGAGNAAPFALGKSCGVILASGYGPATPTFEFLDSLLDFGEGMASPLAFSHSVHNIPAAIIAKTLGITGPCATVCQFDSPVAAGLLLAQTWLAEGRVERVLFGAVDEVTPTLARTAERFAAEGMHGMDAGTGPEKAAAADTQTWPGLAGSGAGKSVTDGSASGGSSSGTGASLLADGAVFFLLSQRDTPGLGVVESVTLSGGPCGAPLPAESASGDLYFLSGTSSRQRAARGAADGLRIHDLHRICGILPVAQAFDCAAALPLLAGTGNRARCTACGTDAHSAVTLTGAPS